MEIDEFLADFQAQPQVKRQRGASAVFWKLTADGEISVLHNVGSIDAALQAPVHAQADHALQPLAVLLDERSQGGLVAVPGGVVLDPGYISLSALSPGAAGVIVGVGSRSRELSPLDRRLLE